MIIEINNTLVNTDNICSARKYLETTDTNFRIIQCYLLYIEHTGGKSTSIYFDSIDGLNVGYLTLKLCETVAKQK